MTPLSTEPLSEEEFDWLNEFLLDRLGDDTDTENLDEGVLDISELDGLLTAVVSGPVMIPAPVAAVRITKSAVCTDNQRLIFF